jgi:hypothetical protein
LREKEEGVVLEAAAGSQFDKRALAFADAPKYFMEDAVLVCLRVHAIAKFQEAAGVRVSWRIEKGAIEIAQIGGLRGSGQFVSLWAGIKDFQKYTPRSECVRQLQYRYCSS